MKFLDEVTIQVIAGKGGNGCMSFRREKFIPFGGPDGGNGGRGGHVIIKAKGNRHTLMDLRYKSIIRAQSGQHGKGSMLTGAKGKDEVIEVPVGTLIFENTTNELVVDLNEEDQEIVIASGGDPGFGNAHYKSSTNRAPRKTTKGFPGEAYDLRLELRLLANAGLLGMPNAGKSSLLRAISAAKPKVANYPFTTLTPQLGVVQTAENPIVVADIPGLIELASQGAGLGFQFLRHLSRCELLLHIVDISSGDLEQVQSQIDTIEAELATYSDELAQKPCWLLLNKIDTMPDQLSWLDDLRLNRKYDYTFKISAITKENVPILLDTLKSWWIERDN
ncbi:MAG: GTPase ObgE [Pseudomonadota bacterium]|nr:GTPase ObgE [Pseudomonadota bacterium]